MSQQVKMINIIKKNWIKITVGACIAFTALYNGAGSTSSVLWVSIGYTIDYFAFAIAVYFASKNADSIEEMFIGFGFSIFKILNALLVIVAVIISQGDNKLFWQILDHTISVYIMIGFAAATSFGGYLANKLIK